MILALPMHLPSVANLREHWATKAKRNKKQREAVALAMKSHRALLLELHAALARGSCLNVVLSRVAPRKLDDDNLASAFKAIRDEVAKQLGVNDGGDSVSWRYLQTSGEPFVLVTIALAESTGSRPPPI